ncbi:YobI family P-loop NTPase, partial [Chishuiella changwenlii]
YHIYDDIINFRITKISPTDIQVTNENKESNESILSKYYDEILNFFINSNVRIVFIEDLDRYEGSVSIFTHLRQINEQLNNSKDLNKKKITFVYAVKDDLLKDEHTKTKFFDLIIPILPFINSNTSREFIITKLKELDNDILDKNPNIKNLIKEISPYINDTRTALNIKNEFIIFKDQYISNWEKNNPNEKDKSISNPPYDKILAIVIYKNLFAKDYVNLLCNSFDSLVYSIFYHKEEFLKNSISEKETRIKEIDDEIKDLQTSHIPDIESLNKIMINSLI